MENDIQKIIIDELKLMVEKIKTAIDTTGSKASGKTQEGLSVGETKVSVQVKSKRHYFQGLEKGHDGKNTPTNFQEIIEQWIKDKGITVEKYQYKTDGEHKYTEEEAGLKRAAFLIARAIKEHGTKLYQEGGRNDIFSPYVNEAVKNIKRKIAIALIKKIKTST